MFLEYYFYNLTTIPKERKFALRDRITNRIIANLDEVFVATLTPGDSFSSKGKVWNVVEIGEELIAEPATQADFIVPDWVGEEVTGDPRYFNSNLVKKPYTKW